jgi:hypothetical protein
MTSKLTYRREVAPGKIALILRSIPVFKIGLVHADAGDHVDQTQVSILDTLIVLCVLQIHPDNRKK